MKKDIWKRKMKKDYLFDIILILLISFLTISWFNGDYMINQGDLGLPMDRAAYFFRTINLWDSSVSLGYAPAGQLASLFPHSIIAILTQLIGLSFVSYNKLLFFFYFTLGGLSMYYLTYVLNFKKITRFTASVFYMINPFTMLIIWHVSHGGFQLPYSIMPLLLALYINLLRNPNIKYVSYFLLSSLFLATYSYTNPPFIVIHFSLLFSYLIFYIITKWNIKDTLKSIKISIILLFFWILINSFWAIPFGLQLDEQFQTAHKPHLLDDVNTLKLNSLKIMDSITLGRVWSLDKGHNGVPYYVYGKYYKNSILITLLLYLIPLLVIFSFLVKVPDGKKAIILYFGVIILFSLFLLKGFNKPFPLLSEKLWTLSPYITGAFRFITSKISPYLILSVSILIGYSIENIFNFFKKKLKIIFLSLIYLSIFIIIVYPMWNGEVIHKGGSQLPGARSKIPDYYQDMNQWLRNDSSKTRIIILPFNYGGNAMYLWPGNYGFVGGDFIIYFSGGKSVIYNYIDETMDPLIDFHKDVEKYSCNKTHLKLLGIYNVKYILFHGDSNWEGIKRVSMFSNENRDNIIHCMDSMGLVNSSISFGELTLYDIDDQYIYPFIYPADNIMYVKNNSEIISKLNQTKEKTIFIEKNNSKNEKISLIHPTPKINFSKIHSSKYIVDIKDSHNGFILVFSEKYSKNWEIFIGEKNPSFFKLLFNKQKQNHLKVNSFANAWYINKKGDFFVTIYYKNQLFYYIGIFITILTASLLIIILFKKK